MRWPCPLPSDRAIPVLWQNLESNVSTAGPPTDFAWLRPATNRNHTRQEAHKHQAPVSPRTPDLFNRDACSHHTESSALPTELRPTGLAIIMAGLVVINNGLDGEHSKVILGEHYFIVCLFVIRRLEFST